MINLDGSNPTVKTWKISTRSELEDLFTDSAFSDGHGMKVRRPSSLETNIADRFEFVEMHMPRDDAPKAPKDIGAKAG